MDVMIDGFDVCVGADVDDALAEGLKEGAAKDVLEGGGDGAIDLVGVREGVKVGVCEEEGMLEGVSV